MGLHTEQDVEEVCEQVIEAMGTRALKRERVQTELKERAVRLGHEPVGVDNEVVGPVIRRVLAKRERARAAAAEADVIAAATGEVPQRLATTLARQSEEITGILATLVAEVQRRTNEEARARIAAVEAATAAQVAELRGDLGALHEEHGALAADLEEMTQLLSAERGRAESLATTLAERTAAYEDLERATRQQVGALGEDLRREAAARARAEERTHAADAAHRNLMAAHVRTEERQSHLERERDLWRDAAAREEARAREAERVSEERRVRLDVVEAERARLQQELAQALGRLGLIEELREMVGATPRPAGEAAPRRQRKALASV